MQHCSADERSRLSHVFARAWPYSDKFLLCVCFFRPSTGSQYLHEQGCPWDASCCSTAALGNHLDCLQYLHENGCPWNESTITAAIAFRSWPCLWYALRHGCPVFYLLPLVSAAGVLVFIGFIACIKERDPAIWYTTYTYDCLLLSVVGAQFLRLFHDKFGDYFACYCEPKTARSIIAYYHLISSLTFLGYMSYVWFFAWPKHVQQ